MTKKGKLKEALMASLKKVRLIEELDWELIQQVKMVFRVVTIFLSFPGHFWTSVSWQLSTGQWRREEG